MKINTLQLGGHVFYLAIDNPFAVPQEAVLTKSSKKDDGIISDKLLEKLYTVGIPSDVENFNQELSEIEWDLSHGINVSVSKMNNLKNKMNRVIQNAEYLKRAEDFAEKNDAVGEIAVGNNHGRAQLYVIDQNSGDVKGVDITQYDLEKHGPAMTVNELIEHRKFNPTQSFDSSIVRIINSNVGMSKITDYIQDIIKTVGSARTVSEAYTDLAGYVGKEFAKRPTEDQLKNIQLLALALSQMGSDAIFKNKQVTESKNLREALQYISSVLPKNMKVQLLGRYVAEGNDYQQGGQYISELILNALQSNNEIKDESYLDYNSDINKAAGTEAGAKSSSSKTFYLTPNEAFFDGDLNLTEVLLSDPSGYNRFGAILKGSLMPILTTDNGNAVSNLPMNIAINETIGKYMDKNYIYMGDQKLNGEAELGNIAYGSDQVARVYMPCDEDGGIDWQGFYRYGEAEDEIKRNGITDPNKKNLIHAEMGSYVRYDLNNQIIPNSHVQEYLLTYGYTIDDHISGDNELVTELTGEAEDAADALLNSIYNKNFAKKTGYKDLPNRQIWDDIYKVPVFIKINKFASSDAYRYGGHGSSMTPMTLEQDMVRQRVRQEPQVKITGASSLLYIDDND